MNGQLDQIRLDALRDALGLTGIGSATDPSRTVLGARSGGGRSTPAVALTLLRSDADAWWILIDESTRTINGEYPASPEAWRGLAEIAVRAAGLTIDDRKELPSL
ncbi:hypothetical protein ACFXHA_12835 [Nocardia sp. NPDC059240]|uniref:hypothetical protein n=1 Tax=Nocardia sp. NPDC059240 TaxID=3346786 RepID=UPI0036AB560A